ncbi:MAG: oligosaccharide flippase family protein [Planctomycetota bacterium]
MSTAASQSTTIINASHDDQSGSRFQSDALATGLLFAILLTIGQRAVGFVRGILFCRFMDDQQLGQWSLIYSYLMLLAPLAVLGLPGCLGKFTEHFRNQGQLGEFLRYVVGYSSTATAIFVGCIFLFPEQFAYFFFRDSTQISLVRFLAAGVVVVAGFNFLTTLMESLCQIKTVTWMRFISGIVFAVFGTGLIFVSHHGAMAATVGFSVGCILGAIPAVWVVYRNRQDFRCSTRNLSLAKFWSRIGPFAMWLWFSDLLHNLFEVSDRYMLIHFSTTSPDVAQGLVGQYHSGRVVPVLFVSIAGMAAGILLPYLSRFWERDEKDSARRALNWFVKLSSFGLTIAGFGVLLFSVPLFDWLLEGRYDDGRSVLPMTLVYCIWMAVIFIAQSYLWVAEKGLLVVISLGSGLLANFCLNYLLIPYYSLHGAVMATTIGNGFVLISVLLMNQKLGCSKSVGIWLAALLPMLLLIDPLIVGFVLLGLCIVALRTNLIFDASEKEQLLQFVQSKLKFIYPAS